MHRYLPKNIRRIAVCLCGETRTFNGHYSSYGEFVNMMQDNYGISVDLFGHVWKRTEMPNDHAGVFKKIIIEDQKIIDEWVKSDFMRRAFSMKDSYTLSIDNPPAPDMFAKCDLYTHTPDEFVNVYLNASRRAYGGSISALTSWSLAANSDVQYDLLIKSRWDLSPEVPADEKEFLEFDNKIRTLDKIFELDKENVENKRQKYGFIITRPTYITEPDNVSISAADIINDNTGNKLDVPVLNMSDVVIMMNYAAMMRVPNKDRFEIIDSIIDNNYANLMGHIQWMKVLANFANRHYVTNSIRFERKR